MRFVMNTLNQRSNGSDTIQNDSGGIVVNRILLEQQIVSITNYELQN